MTNLSAEQAPRCWPHPRWGNTTNRWLSGWIRWSHNPPKAPHTMGSGEGGVSGVAGGLATNIRSRVAHVGAHWRVIARIGIAPALAWWVSTAIFGHSQAFFAPIAAILTLTIGVGRRATVVVEIIVGASVGVLVGELLVHLIGRGVWQMVRSEEHTSELQSRGHLVCRLLLEKKTTHRGCTTRVLHRHQ